MRVRTRWVGGVALIVLMLVGSGSVGVGWAGERVTLQMLSAEGDPNSVAAMRSAIEEFRKTHPNVNAEYQTVSWTELGQKIVASAAAGTPPDIVHLDDFAMSVLSEQGILEPAGDVVEAIGRGDYFPLPLRAVTFKDTTWGVPFSNGFDLLWYRKDLYAKHSLQPPKTWDELLNNVKTLHANLPGVGQMYGIALALSNSNHTNDTIEGFMWSNGAAIMDREGKLTLDSPQAVQAYNYLRELYKYGPPGAGQYGNLEVLNAFATGRVAHTNYPARMVLHVMRTNPKLADSVGVVIKPKGPDPKGRYAATLYSKAWGFPKGGKHLALAKEFVQFLQTGEREIRWLHSVPVHFWPPRKSTATSAAYRNDPIIQSPIGQAAAQAILEQGLPNAQAQLTSSGVVNRQPFKVLQAHVLAKMMQKMVLGNAATDQAVAEAMREARDLVSQ
jgi:multiple sugar transport system substrate-binding protein